MESPARAYEHALDLTRPREDAYALLAVRALSVLVLAVGAMLFMLALIQRSYGPLTLLGQSRALMGGCLFGGGVAVWGLALRRWNRSSATLSIALALLALLALMLHAWHSGLGTHSIVLGAIDVALIAAWTA